MAYKYSGTFKNLHLQLVFHLHDLKFATIWSRITVFRASFRKILVQKYHLVMSGRRKQSHFQDFVVEVHPRYLDFRAIHLPTFLQVGASYC